MSKYSGVTFSVFLVDGYSLAASISEAVEMGEEAITQQTNPFGVATESHTPNGLVKGFLTVGGGFFDTTTDALHGALASTVVSGLVTSVARIVCAAIEDNIIGKHFIGFEGAYSQKYAVVDKKDGLTMANVTYLVTGAIDEGVIVDALTAITADQTPPTSDTPVDNASDSFQRNVNISSATKANPCVVTTAVAHGLTTGQKVLITGNTLAGPAINSDLAATVLSTTTFSVAVNTSASSGAGTGGTVTPASTVNGGVGYIQATAFSGFTGYIGKIMHSDDDTTYAAICTFTNITAAPAKERIAVAAGTTVKRYLSAFRDVTGSGSITAFMGFARN